tara:strand:- start:793 stop:2175 length:1383 start_codon:yes stop_codon:yes gene_type:complete
MATLESIDEVLATHQPALPSTRLSMVEQTLTRLLLFLVIGVTLGLVLMPEIVWDDGLRPIIWEPIQKDAGAQGDAGYSYQNTAIYTFSLLASVVVFQALFRTLQLPADDKMMIALIAWVCLAPIFRVLEDGDFFPSSIDWLLISPIIHLHLAAWLIGIGFISHLIGKEWDSVEGDVGELNIRIRLVPLLCLALLFMWALLFRPGYSEHDMGLLWVFIGLGIGFASLIFTVHATRDWPTITRGLLAFAVGACFVGLGHWAQLAATPWVQESGRLPNEVVLWPALVVLGIPGIVCAVLYRIGKDDARQLKLTGFEAGVLPEGISIKSWETEEKTVANHPIEQLSNKALLASPLVLAMVFGQLCDGFATMVGIDYFNYSEKHPLSDAVIQYGGGISDSLGWDVEGAWLFAIVKAILVGTITYIFVEMRVENRQKHLRLLIVLAVLIVGLAPGIRDIGRLMLGV